VALRGGDSTAWYGESCELERLVETLGRRRSRVAELILQFRNSSRAPFPKWRDVVKLRKVGGKSWKIQGMEGERAG